MRALIVYILCILWLSATKLCSHSLTKYSAKEDYVKIPTTKKDSIIEKFLKKISEAVHLKKTLREKEKQRIIYIVDSIITNDPYSIPKLKQLNDELTLKVNHDFNTLIKILKTISDDKEVMKKSLNNAIEQINELKNKGEEPISNQELDQLVAKILPIVTQKIKSEESEKEKQKKINLVRKLFINPEGIRDTLVINDTLSKTYTLKLKLKGEVVGHHPYWMKNRYPNYNFNLISTLAYYGYELDGKTGNYKTIHGWDTTKVIDKAKKNGCKVLLSVFCTSKADLSAFLKDDEAQRNFSNTIIELLELRKADGVNIIFEPAKGNNRSYISKFIRSFSHSLKNANSNYKLFLTLPSCDENLDYDISYINNSVDYFIIDFSKKNEFGPIIPLKGDKYSLDAGISYYTSIKTPSERLIACFPYRGVLWDVASETFNEYIPLSNIAELYSNEFGKVSDNNSSMRTDVVVDGDTIEQLWFDDANTLSEKYEYALNNNLGGIAIWSLGDDNNSTEMWNAIIDKLVGFDTTNIDSLIVPGPIPDAELTLWQKIKKEILLYKLLFSHPCDFKDSDKKDMKADDIIGYIAGIFCGLLIIVGIYTIAQKKSLGDDWKHNKLFLSILIVLVMLVMISGLMFFFLNPDYTTLGHSHDNCETSFWTILQVLGIGFLIGLLAMKILVFPLIKRKEIP